MLNFLPALILLIVQGSSGTEVSSRQLSLLLDLSSRSQGPLKQSAATAEERKQLMRLLGDEQGRSMLSQAGLSVWGLVLSSFMGDEGHSFAFPEGPTAEPLKSVVPSSDSGKPTSGFQSSGRTRDGPQTA